MASSHQLLSDWHKPKRATSSKTAHTVGRAEPGKADPGILSTLTGRICSPAPCRTGQDWWSLPLHETSFWAHSRFSCRSWVLVPKPVAKSASEEPIHHSIQAPPEWPGTSPSDLKPWPPRTQEREKQPAWWLGQHVWPKLQLGAVLPWEPRSLKGRTPFPSDQLLCTWLFQ